MSCTLVYTEMAKHRWMKCQHPESVLLWHEVSHLWQPATLMPPKWWCCFWDLKAPHFAKFILPMLSNNIMSFWAANEMPINEKSPSFSTFTCSTVHRVWRNHRAEYAFFCRFVDLWRFLDNSSPESGMKNEHLKMSTTYYLHI